MYNYFVNLSAIVVLLFPVLMSTILSNSSFLDTLRLNNPVLFTLTINIHVSILIGLLSCLSYAISFYLKQRIIIFFTPLVIMIFFDLILSLNSTPYFSGMTPLNYNDEYIVF